jgi:hypothetical protein
VSTASRYCRIHMQRLQSEDYASSFSGSGGTTPRALRPARLQWLNMLDKSVRKCGCSFAKIAAFHDLALSLSAISSKTISICGLEALAGTSPPFSRHPYSRGPPP